MSFLEFEGRNLNKAVKKACQELNMIADEIQYDVLSYGSSGIFGLAGAKKARIRVKLPDKPQTESTESEKTEISGMAEGDVAESALKDEHDLNPQGGDFTMAPGIGEEPVDIGQQVLARIVESITAEASITAGKNSERITFDIAGGNPAVLIGKKGQTLEAIQTIVEKVVNKHHNHAGNDKIRVQVDVEGYLKTRKANLEKRAIRLAGKVKKNRKPISLGPMRARDRRIVHLVLKADPNVRTKSKGEGPLRNLVIFPNKNKPIGRSTH